MMFSGPRMILLALATLAAPAAVAAFPASASARPSALAPDALAHARSIRAKLNARYRLLPRPKLVITEATTTGVVDSLTLIDSSQPQPWRVVPADNGIYFAICSTRASRPHPARSAWPAVSFLPRREALELALRTFLETNASLVVVALPAAEPVWVVFERDDLLTEIDAAAALGQLASNPAVVDEPLRQLVDRFTRPRLFVPLPVLPPPDDTIYAMAYPSDP
jgi:hypothetical protein